MAELGSYDDEHESGFFDTLPTPPALIGGLELLAEAQALARKIPGDIAAAAEVDSLIAVVEDRVAKAAIATAGVSEEAIKRHITLSRKRPEASGARKHLVDGIRSEPIGLGGVGIAAIADLDTVVGSDGKPFWRAQEYGSDHLVGRIIFGLFQPGGVPADGGLFRRHPIFETGGPEAAPMMIKRPIPARHFLRTGSAEAAVFREKEFAGIQAAAIDLIRAIRSTLAAL